MEPLVQIDKLTLDFAAAQQALASEVLSINSAIDVLKRDHLKTVKKLFSSAVERRTKLKAEIEQWPALFVKPKTLVLHGIKIGFIKNKGSLKIEDKEQTIKLIKKYFPELVDSYIKTEETPVKKILEDLSGSDLKKIGITIEGAGEEVVIKPVDSDIDKIMKALFKEMDNEPGE